MRRLRMRVSPSRSTTSKVTRWPVRKNRNMPWSMAPGSMCQEVSPSSETMVPVLALTSYSLTDPCGNGRPPATPSSVPEALQQGLPAGPVRLHLHPEVQEDPAPEQLLHLRPRPGADLLQHPTAPADDDPLLGVALDVDGCRDEEDVRGVSWLHLVHDDGDRVGDLLRQQLEHLLPDHLGDGHRPGLVADGFLRVVLRPLGQPVDQRADEVR